jgi:tetratricopeptide (TPR) repeat protein
VSSKHIAFTFFGWLLLTGMATAFPLQTSTSKTIVAPATTDPARLFVAGQNALREGHLVEAEELHKAEHLMPQEPGIRLNIGLAYYRQNDFLKAIPAFQSVVRDEPEAFQPRYLLGLCYFFTDRWSDAVATLEQLWARESTQLSYLYVLSISAHRAGNKELDEKATAQLMKIGEGSPEYHLFMGKAHLNLEQYDLALADFKAAAEANPKLPFVHFQYGPCVFEEAGLRARPRRVSERCRY